MTKEDSLIKTLAIIKKCPVCGKTETELIRGGSRIWVCENKDCSMKIDTKKVKNWKRV